MRSMFFLRAASITALAAGAGHTLRFLSYVPRHGAEESAVVNAMRNHWFEFGGFAPHSYWDMYLGYGLFVSIGCLSEAVLFWQLSKFAESCPSLVRSVTALFILMEAGYAALIWRYFFPLPLFFHTAIAVALLLAFRASVPLAVST